MIDVLVAVILIAWFFGISYTAALHGLLGFIAWIVILGFAIIIIQDVLDSVNSKPAPIRKPKKPVKDIKIHPFFKWLFCFFISYLITSLFVIIIGAWDSSSTIPFWLFILIPTLPFDIILVRHFIRKIISRKYKK